MIPKKIHQVWLGDKEPPKQFVEWANQWKEKHPDFEYKLWRENDFGENDFVKAAIKFNEYRFVCDWVRCNILYQEGGIYVDFDIKPYKRISEDLLNYDFFVTRTGKWWFMNGFMGSIKKSKGIKAYVEECSSYHNVMKLFKESNPDYNKWTEHELFTNCWADGELLQRILPIVYKDNILIDKWDGTISASGNKVNLVESDVMHLWPINVDPLTISRRNLIGIHRPKI